MGPWDPEIGARRRLRLAGEDPLTAHTMLDHQKEALRIVGVLAQQAAEKALKALAAHDLRVPRTPNLDECSGT